MPPTTMKDLVLKHLGSGGDSGTIRQALVESHLYLVHTME